MDFYTWITKKHCGFCEYRDCEVTMAIWSKCHPADVKEYFKENHPEMVSAYEKKYGWKYGGV